MNKHTEKLKQSGKKVLEYKYIILLYILIIILLKPIFVLSRSAVPAADDFWYSQLARNVYLNGGSIFKIIGAAIEKTIHTYKTWQGTYSSIFMMSLQPGLFSLELYRTAPVVLLFITLMSPLFLAYIANKFLFKTESRVLYVISALYSFFTLQFMPSIFEGIYWFNAAWYYTFSFNIVIVMIAVIIIFEKTNKKITRIISFILMILFAIYLAGTNYPQVLMLTVGSSFFILLVFIRKNPKKWRYVIVWAVLGICIAVSLFAPGNRAVVDAPSNLRYTALCMLRNFTTDVSSWTVTYLTLAVCLVSIPFLKRLLSENKIKFLHPAIMGTAAFLVLLCMYTPAAFSFHNAGPVRAENVRMMVMQLFIYTIVINGYGYYYNKKDKRNSLILNPIAAAILFILIMTSSFANERIMDAWSIKAEYSIMGLEVSKFTTRMNEFFDLLEDDEVKNIKIDPLPTHEMLMPNLKMFRDYKIESYYGKEDAIYYKTD